MLFHVVIFIIAFAMAYAITPIVRKGALQFGIVDKPDDKLKNHKEPVPYLGGLAVFLAFMVSLAITYEFNNQVLGLLLAGSIMVILGLIDDFGVLSPRVKLSGQILVALVLVKAGIRVELSFIPFWLSLSISVLWLVALANAFNLIDIMDGLASGVAFICAMVLYSVNVMNDRLIIASLTVALAGSLLGFVPYNFKPAKIYLGDTGSMFIGLTLGALAMIGSYTEMNQLAAVAPVIILGVPIFDMLFVMYIRFRRGMPMMLGSPDHFALRLRKWRLSVKQTVVISYFVTLLLGLCGVWMMLSSMTIAAAILIGLVMVGLLTGYLLKKIDMTL